MIAFYRNREADYLGQKLGSCQLNAKGVGSLVVGESVEVVSAHLLLVNL